MDEGLSRAVRHVFVSLYEKDLIYKGSRIINWAHVELSGDVGGRHDDGEGLFLGVPAALEAAAFLPLLVNAALCFLGLVDFRRYKRMQGYAALYLPGTDHAGIATQVKVELVDLGQFFFHVHSPIIRVLIFFITASQQVIGCYVVKVRLK